MAGPRRLTIARTPCDSLKLSFRTLVQHRLVWLGVAPWGHEMNIWQAEDTRVLEIDGVGPEIGSERSAIDLIGETYGQEIDVIAIPTSRLSPDFLTLRTGIAGGFLQKFMNYGYRVAIIGDISAATLASQALRDFVTESNRGGQVLFVRNLDELKQRL